MDAAPEPHTKRYDTQSYANLSISLRKTVWVWPAVGAVFGLTGGLICILFGTVLLIINWLRAPVVAASYLKSVETVFFLLALPLLIFGGHCLDLAEKEPRRRAAAKLPPDASATNSAERQTARRLIVAVGAPLFLLLLLLWSFQTPTRAQQTLFNVPSTDVLDRGKVYGELDAPFRITEPRFSSFVPRVVVGVGRRVEIGLNVTGNIQPGVDATTLVPAVKWKAYDGQENGFAFVIGDNLFVPVRHRAYHVGNYLYAELSKTFSTKTRLTFGGYDFTRNTVARSNRAGGQFGFEQPVTKKFGLQADWFTGKHASGYFTPGIVYKPTAKLTGYFGYSLANTNLSNGNRFFYGEIGFNFN